MSVEQDFANALCEWGAERTAGQPLKLLAMLTRARGQADVRGTYLGVMIALAEKIIRTAPNSANLPDLRELAIVTGTAALCDRGSLVVPTAPPLPRRVDLDG